jgi:hypothetical protein
LLAHPVPSLSRPSSNIIDLALRFSVAITVARFTRCAVRLSRQIAILFLALFAGKAIRLACYFIPRLNTEAVQG